MKSESLLFGDIIMNVITQYHKYIPLPIDTCEKILSKCPEHLYDISDLEAFELVFDLFVNRLGFLEDISDEFKEILNKNKKIFKDVSIAYLTT